MNSKNPDRTKDSINPEDNYTFLVGKIVGFRGLKGELKVVPATNSLDILTAVEKVRLVDQKGLGKIENVAQIKTKGKMLFLQLENYTDRNSVELLRNQKIYTQENQLLELNDDEWWSKDLVGLMVMDQQGNKLGIISDIFGEQGEFLEVELINSKKKCLVPFVKEVVPKVNIDKGIIEVAPPEGLFD